MLSTVISLLLATSWHAVHEHPASSLADPGAARIIVVIDERCAKALANCTCTPEEGLSSDRWPATGTACLAFFIVLENVESGVCIHEEACPNPGQQYKSCKADLVCTVQVANQGCGSCPNTCNGIKFDPNDGWGTGCTLPGFSVQHTYQQVNLACIAGPEDEEAAVFSQAVHIKECTQTAPAVVTVTWSMTCVKCPAQ